MNEIRATYEINRNDAVLAGKSVYGQQTVIVDPAQLTPEQRAELVTCETHDGAYRLDHLAINGSMKSVPRLSEPSQDAVRIYLDARIAARKEAAAEVARKKAEGIALLSDPAQWIRPSAGNIDTGSDLFPDLRPRLRAVHIDPICRCMPDEEHWTVRRPYAPGAELDSAEEARIRAEAERLAAEHNAPILERCRAEVVAAIEAAEAETAEKAAAEERRAAQISEWVTLHGDDSQKKRFAADLLPEQEAINGIRTLAFAPLDEFPRYAKISLSDFCECEYPDRDSVEFSVATAAEAMADEFAQMEEIRAAITAEHPEASISLQLHRGYCDRCEEELTRKSVRVELTVGEFTFSRLYVA